MSSPRTKWYPYQALATAKAAPALWMHGLRSYDMRDDSIVGASMQPKFWRNLHFLRLFFFFFFFFLWNAIFWVGILAPDTRLYC